MNQNKILEILSFPPEAEKAILTVLSKKQYVEVFKTAYQGIAPDYPIIKRKPLTRLAAVVFLLGEKYDNYSALGIPDKIIEDTFQDVSLRANLYFLKTGKIGISKEDSLWFRHIMNISIFKIQSLQFQPFSMTYLDEETLGEPYMIFTKEQKEMLPTGAHVINCHIQHGADLSIENIKASFYDAQALFKTIYPKIEFRAFLCYSWLLYPDMLSLLSEDSKIKTFAENFEIISKIQDSEQAFENLFGKVYKRPLKIERPTFLQKIAKENPKAFGFACGIRYL